ncbi:MAG: hypothetical protein IKY27_08630 [Bacteroidales bacterium]|nr:hypothetical protein [Bacteroidales bacterium]
MFDNIIASVKGMGGVGSILKTLPKSKINEFSLMIESFIANKLQSVELADSSESPAALIIEGNGQYMINIVTISEDLTVLRVIERISVRDLAFKIVEDLKNA